MVNKELLISPYNEEAEGAVLGSALYYQDSRDEMLTSLEANDFYVEKNKVLYDIIKQYTEQKGVNADIDAVSFESFARSLGALDKCGGMKTVAAYINNSPIPENIPNYISIIKDLSIRRSTIKLSSNMGEKAADETRDIGETIDTATSELNELSIYGSPKSDFVRVSEIISGIHDDILDLSIAGVQSGIMTGFDELDKKTGGFKPGQYIVVAARPSCGKTAFALSCMSYMLDNQVETLYSDKRKDENGKFLKNTHPTKVAFFSLEMPKEDIVKRLFSMRSLVPYKLIADNKLSDPNGVEETKLFNALDRLIGVSSNLFISDPNTISMSDLKRLARKIKRNEDIDIIFIDYLSRINKRGMNQRMEDWEVWSEFSRELKDLARELNIPIVCLAQLNREAEGSSPTLANIRGTGALEQDADIVIMLHDPDRTKEGINGDQMPGYNLYVSDGDVQGQITKKNTISVILAKQRNGETGSSEIVLASDYVRFVNQEQIVQ